MRSLDPHEIIKCLFTSERIINRQGWDAPPSLWPLYVESNGEVVPGTPPMAIANPDGDDAVRMLQRVIAALHLPAGQAARTVIATDSWVGYMLSAEVWTLAADSPEKMEAGDKREIYRHPQRVEARLVMAIDLTGHLRQVKRDRGGDPEVMEIVDQVGRVPLAMRALLDATRAPEGSGRR